VRSSSTKELKITNCNIMLGLRAAYIAPVCSGVDISVKLCPAETAVMEKGKLLSENVCKIYVLRTRTKMAADNEAVTGCSDILPGAEHSNLWPATGDKVQQGHCCHLSGQLCLPPTLQPRDSMTQPKKGDVTVLPLESLSMLSGSTGRVPVALLRHGMALLRLRGNARPC
jgi:Fe-S cluster assembly iron-binding protein IscA